MIFVGKLANNAGWSQDLQQGKKLRAIYNIPASDLYQLRNVSFKGSGVFMIQDRDMFVADDVDGSLSSIQRICERFLELGFLLSDYNFSANSLMISMDDNKSTLVDYEL